jgi:hypothetical protein
METRMNFRYTSLLSWALPGVVFVAGSVAFSACGAQSATGGGEHCSNGGAGTTTSTTHTSSSTSGIPASTLPQGAPDTTSNNSADTFDHFNDPGSDGSLDPFQILQQREEEGPPEIRTRMHSCTKVAYASLGSLLSSMGVASITAKTPAAGSAGDLYQNGSDAYGAAKFDAREAETYFQTTASATKLFDIFVMSAPEIIANITSATLAPLCTYNGVNKPMFDPTSGACVYESASCIMGRPATPDDLALCNNVLAQVDPTVMNDLVIKQNIAVAVLLSAAHTCE